MDGGKGVVDGDRHGLVGQRAAVPQGGDDLGQGQDGVAAVGQVGQVGAELLHADVRCRDGVLAEAMVHEDDGGRALGRARRQGRGQQDQGRQQDGQEPAHGWQSPGGLHSDSCI